MLTGVLLYALALLITDAGTVFMALDTVATDTPRALAMSFMVIGADCSIVKFRLYGRLAAMDCMTIFGRANLLRLAFALYLCLYLLY